MRADVEDVLDQWRRRNRAEGRRLAGTSAVADLEDVLGSEPVIWFQQVQWWPPSAAATTQGAVDVDDIFGGSILGLATADEGPSGQPDAGVVAVTATRLLLVGERTRWRWALRDVAGFTFQAARFVESTAAHFELRTPAGLHRLLPGRKASPERMLTEFAGACARTIVVPAESPVAATDRGEPTAALLTQLLDMRDRGLITQAQFEDEQKRLLS